MKTPKKRENMIKTEPREPTLLEISPDIVNIRDFRVKNGLLQYNVEWKSLEGTSDKIGVSWTDEDTLEAACNKEKIVKYWVKLMLLEDDILTPRNKQIFTEKLTEWINTSDEDCGHCSKPNNVGSNNCKTSSHLNVNVPLKRSRQDCPDGDGDLIGTGIKQPRLTTNIEDYKDLDYENKLAYREENFDYMISEDLGPNSYDLLVNEVGDLMHVSKLGETHRYEVEWQYISYETPSTLGLCEKVLQRCLDNLQLDGVNINPKIQFKRKRFIPSKLNLSPAFIKFVGNKSKSSCSSSDYSDCSNASTRPPLSDPEDMNDAIVLDGPFPRDLSMMKNMGMGFIPISKVEAEVQTDVEINPFICQYCKHKKRESERVSSLRGSKVVIKKEIIEDEIEDKPKRKGKNIQADVKIKVEIPEQDQQENEEELVDIDYEIEQVLDYHRGPVKVGDLNEDHYLIKWKGFTSDYDSWEPESNLNCDKFIVNFYTNRILERRNYDQNVLKILSKNLTMNVRKLPKMPSLPPLPDIVKNFFDSLYPVTDEEIEQAYQILKTTKKNSKWSKKRIRQCLVAVLEKTTIPENVSHFRHQMLMIEAERRKDILEGELKNWGKHLNSITQGKPEIVIENAYDLSGPPLDFQYTNDNIIGQGVIFPDGPLEGCDCEDSCMKDKACCPAKHGKVLAYNSYKRLRVLPGYPIYECNKHCKCGPDCANRVVQDGTMSLVGTKLCIFRTSDKRGWGVKTLKKIKKGTFVCLYAGEIITTEEAENRGQIYENQLGACYLFDLDYYTNDDDESCPYTIDATKVGNVAHFINHSCDPNLAVFNVWADCLDQNLPKLAFFAMRDISKDEELTYDYGSHGDSDVNESSPAVSPLKSVITPSDNSNEESNENDDEDSESMLSLSVSPSKNRMKRVVGSSVRRPCLCSAKNCRKVLF